MEKELCFNIEGNKLYLEQALVDYNDIPIFFVCKDDETYYVVLCSDIEELSYIVVNLSELELYNLLHGKLSMREVFTKQPKYWEIISGEEIESDTVICKHIEGIDCSVLPQEGAYFEILTDEVSSYVKKFDNMFLSTERFEDLLQKPDYNENLLNEILENSLEFMERFVELWDCQQRISVGFQSNDIAYGETMDAMSNPNTIITKQENYEEWMSTDINILAYAA
ncbi:hypothetical protein [Acetatifactor aquisgranensis]|jgi:hypothetical protein|uniref:hypothetical protein n=1 Tax=Acetatifactor aquisgranensis TaxID=2941233 RepID=UPI00203DC1EF|nr:hypothetical protein [Acetatifactor aquisgranensis]